MNKKIKNLLHKEKGNALIIFSLLLVVILGMIGITLDGGILFVTKTHLQKTANAAALSGAQELFNTETTITTIVNDILNKHNEQNSLNSLTIEMGSQVTIDLRKTVSLSFLPLFGFGDTVVTASATAKVFPMGRGKGAAPLGIDDAIPLEFYKSYKLKVDQTEVSAGNFGILALEGPGAKTYEDNLRNGYSGEIKVGDIIETQTGNIAGKTKTVINERINNCPYLPGDIHHRDCSRILLVPVYTPYNFTSNQLKTVKVTGFAYFYILEPMSSHDTSVTGMFIERVGTGFGSENNIIKGAYTVKLVK
ncbi:MAG: Tad domain-containing protein [Marinisporobacter sp.]|jgi:hypothetical protein|nr:Tad domain-containing protein [Marinisporobacter sp.]